MKPSSGTRDENYDCMNMHSKMGDVGNIVIHFNYVDNCQSISRDVKY